MKVFIGTDPKDWLAYDVLVASIRKHASLPVDIIPIRDHELRFSKLFWRSYHVDSNGQAVDDRDGMPFSSLFSFQRFCVPMMNNFRDERVLFMDADMMLRCDVTEIFDYAPNDKAVSVVQHHHAPKEDVKMGGNTLQTRYFRKNWSSLMVMNTAKCAKLNAYNVNNKPGSWLHALGWVDDSEIGSLNEAFNWLDGWSDPGINAQVVHFTRGTPEMPGCSGLCPKYEDEWWSYVDPEIKKELSHAA